MTLLCNFSHHNTATFRLKKSDVYNIIFGKFNEVDFLIFLTVQFVRFSQIVNLF